MVVHDRTRLIGLVITKKVSADLPADTFLFLKAIIFLKGELTEAFPTNDKKFNLLCPAQ